MGDRITFRLEDSLPELEEQLRLGVFSKREVCVRDAPSLQR